MAIAFDAASNGAGSAGATSITWAHTSAGGRLIVAVSSTTNGVTGVTYAGAALTQVSGFVQNLNNNYYISRWEKATTATGANNIVVSAGASIGLYGCSASYTGMATTMPPEAVAYGTTQTLAVVTVTDNAWAVICHGTNTTPITGSAGTTVRAVMAIGILIGDADAAKTPPGSVALGITEGGYWNGIIASLAPSVAGMGRMLLVF